MRGLLCNYTSVLFYMISGTSLYISAPLNEEIKPNLMNKVPGETEGYVLIKKLCYLPSVNLRIRDFFQWFFSGYKIGGSDFLSMITCYRQIHW